MGVSGDSHQLRCSFSHRVQLALSLSISSDLEGICALVCWGNVPPTDHVASATGVVGDRDKRHSEKPAPPLASTTCFLPDFGERRGIALPFCR